MRYVDDLKNALLAEFDEVEADWRETAERQYEYLTECEYVPTPEETDEADCEPICVINGYVQSVEELANNWIADTIQWGEVAKARIKARAKAAKAKARPKTKKKEAA